MKVGGLALEPIGPAIAIDVDVPAILRCRVAMRREDEAVGKAMVVVGERLGPEATPQPLEAGNSVSGKVT